MKFANGIDAGSVRVANVATPSSGTDAVTKTYADGLTGASFSVVDKTTNYTLTNSDDVVTSATASVVLTLHNASTATVKRYYMHNRGSSNISFATTSSQTVDGSTTGTIIPNQSITVVPYSGNWIIV